MSILVIAEHDHAILKPTSLKVINAAAQIGDEITVLVAGYQCASVAASVAKVTGVKRVKLVDEPHYAFQSAENMAALIVEQAAHFSHILAAATSSGKNLLPRVAALLDVAQISDIIRIVSTDTFVRPIYAGNALAIVQSEDPIKVMTVRPTAFSAANEGGCAEIEICSGQTDLACSRVLDRQIIPSSRPELTSAKVIVAGGRGLGSPGQYQAILQPLADKLQAALGTSRAAVDAHFAPNDYQIGQTGKIVAPQLYIAVGISGAIQHVAGIKNSKVIVAINKDPDAPIFQIADYGLVANLFEAVPALVAALEE